MVRSIIMVIALLVGFCYCAAFLMWNAELTTDVVVWNLGTPQQWLADIPIAFLPIVGTMIGALIMAIAAWMPWASQRAVARSAKEKMTKAIDRFSQQKEQIEAQRQELEELRERLAQAEAAAAPPVAVQFATDGDEDEEPGTEEILADDELTL